MYYDHKNIKFARDLRKNMTPWERKLWYCFLRAYSPRFQRQKTIDHYIVDFFCAKANLIIELDGSGHYEPEKEKRDIVRTKQLEQHGFEILRFCNSDIDKNFYSVCSVIDHAVKRRTLPQSASLTAPSEREPRSNWEQE